MPKIIRKTAKIFGGALSAGSQQVEQFGSKVQSGIPFYTVDPDVIQGLSAWVDGWIPAIDSGTKAPYVQDMNGFCLVMAYQIAYILQQGIPEWIATTTYYLDSVVQANDGQWYSSLEDNNIGNAPPASASNAHWLWMNPPVGTLAAPIASGNIPMSGGASPNGPSGSVLLAASNITDEGTDIKIAVPLKFPDNTIQASSAAPVSVQNVVTGSRSIGTVFQNTTSRPIFVSVTSGTTGDGGNGAQQAVTDSNPSPTTVVAKLGVASTAPLSPLNLFFIVLPGNYYKVTNLIGTYTLTQWIEWS